MATSGSMPNVLHQTLQITAIIAAGALALAGCILCAGLVIVIAHDGNTQEVTSAMNIIADVIPNIIYALAILSGAVGATAVLSGRFPSGILGNSNQSATPPTGG